MRWTPTGRASASCSRPAMRRLTATRIPTVRAACATSSSRCANVAPRRGRCWRTAAAKKWGVTVGEVETQVHEVVHKPSGRKLGLRRACRRCRRAAGAGGRQDQAEGRECLPLYRQGQRSHRRHRRHHHRAMPIYGQDIVLPGMKYAVVARPPVVGGKVASLDSSAAMKVPGVEKIVTLQPTPAPDKFAPFGGVAVIAKNTWAALKGREALKITWDDGTQQGLRLQGLSAPSSRRASRSPARSSATSAMSTRRWHPRQGHHGRVLCSPHHHATMEPPAAAARMTNGKWEVWAPVQSPGRRARRRRQSAWRQARGNAAPRHAARRWLRPQIQVRLRHRGGVAVQGDGRHAGQGGMDARG